MRSWNEIRKAATVFSERWKGAYDEKSQALSFLKNFFEVLDAAFGQSSHQKMIHGKGCVATVK